MRTPGPDSSPEERAAYNEYMRLYMLRRHREHRARGIAHLGGVCVGCGTDRLDEFDFHHIDPTTKSFTISSGLKFGWARLVVEIDKCELRCREHHVNHHRSTAPCGTARRYWRGCRCEACRSALREYARSKRARA